MGKIKEILNKILKKIYDPQDPHCGGCTFNCSLHSPNCHIGEDKAKIFFARHPELKKENSGDINGVNNNRDQR